MRNIHFEVPEEVIREFCEKLIESGLDNSIVDLTEQGDIEIKVAYEKGDEDTVNELEDYLEELKESIEEDQGDED